VPAARLTALRRAFDQTMKDPELLAEADKAQLEIAPVDGETLQAMVERMFQAPKDVIDAARQAIGQH
jgi:tripartite-type tricarboxylate transporter receptor subunit TctC